MSLPLRSLIHKATKLSPLIVQSIKARPYSSSSLRMSSQADQSKMKSVPADTQKFLDALKIRRSNYTLSKESSISDEGVQSIIEQSLEEVPSTFGSFTTRIVLATGDQHDKFWDLTKEIVKAVTPAEQWEKSTEGKLNGFKAGHGTILFFESPESTRQLQDKFPFIKDKFVQWSEHTNAMHQMVIWTALAVGGNGANLQHYNPLIDERLKKDFNIPLDWELVAQMVYGKPTSPPGPKPDGMKKPLSERLIIAGEQ